MVESTRHPPVVTSRASPPGPFRQDFWRSPLRGPWLSSLLGAALMPLIVTCAFTGYLSHAAYDPNLGHNAVNPGGVDLYFFRWPTHPAWLYAVTQGLHVAAGVAAIPLLLAKLWAVIPKLFEWPPIRSIAHAIERLSLALLVGSGLFVLATGLLNIQLFYAWRFSFVPVHYYAAILFLAALAFHVVVKLPVARRAFRERGVLAPLRESLIQTAPEPAGHDTTAPTNPGTPTISRRGFVATVGVATAGLGVMAGAQSVGGPLRDLALLTPHGRTRGSGPNDFQINKPAATVGVSAGQTGPDWRLVVMRAGATPLSFSRADLLGMAQFTYDLPIACVEGWTTTQRWTGVRLGDLARAAGAGPHDQVLVESLQTGGAFHQATLAANAVNDSRALLALRVNGVDLSLDHGYPARLIVPALPGVHCTKWVSRMTFAAEA